MWKVSPTTEFHNTAQTWWLYQYFSSFIDLTLCLTNEDVFDNVLVNWPHYVSTEVDTQNDGK